MMPSPYAHEYHSAAPRSYLGSPASRTFEISLAHCFFLLFAAQILSPELGGVTLYLELIIAGANPFFASWLLRRKPDFRINAIASTVLFCSIAGDLLLGVKLLSLALAVLFLLYAESRRVFYLFPYILLSVALAAVQFTFTFIDLTVARALGPSNISELVWGDYATQTYTNFFTVFWLPRVSGLSREAGFLAALVSVYMLLILKQDRMGILSPSRLKLSTLALGFFFSFSKISLALPIAFLFDRVRAHLRAVPFAVVTLVTSLLIYLVTLLNQSVLFQQENISLLHRFGAYLALPDASVEQILFGVDHIRELQSHAAHALPDDYDRFAGLAGLVLAHGAIVVVGLLLGLYLAGVDSVGILMLMLFTANVDLVTNQNFVVLAYFVVFKYYAPRRFVLR
jgi:hypothetical protein